CGHMARVRFGTKEPLRQRVGAGWCSHHTDFAVSAGEPHDSADPPVSKGVGEIGLVQRDELEAGRDLHPNKCAAPRTTFPGLLLLVASCAIVGTLSTWRPCHCCHTRDGAAIAHKRCAIPNARLRQRCGRSSCDRPTFSPRWALWPDQPSRFVLARASSIGAGAVPSRSMPSAVVRTIVTFVCAAAGIPGRQTLAPQRLVWIAFAKLSQHKRTRAMRTVSGRFLPN